MTGSLFQVKEFPVVLKNGFCRVEYENKDVYEGEFKQNLRDGQGTYYFAAEVAGEPGVVEHTTRYEGGFKNEFFEGFGKYYYETDVYEGEWKESFKHGQGSFYKRAGPGGDKSEDSTYVGGW